MRAFLGCPGCRRSRGPRAPLRSAARLLCRSPADNSSRHVCRRRAAVAGAPSALDLGAPRELAPGVTLYHLTDPRCSIPRRRCRSGCCASILARRISAPCSPTTRSSTPRSSPTWPPGMARSPRSTPASSCCPPAIRPASTSCDGQLVSDTRRPRGAVGIVRDGRPAASGLRPRRRDDGAASAAARPARRRDGDCRRRHDATARQADAVHAGLSRRIPIPPPAGSSGSCEGQPLRVASGPLRPARRRSHATGSCCRSAARGRRRRCNR